MRASERSSEVACTPLYDVRASFGLFLSLGRLLKACPSADQALPYLFCCLTGASGTPIWRITGRKRVPSALGAREAASERMVDAQSASGGTRLGPAVKAGEEGQEVYADATCDASCVANAGVQCRESSDTPTRDQGCPPSDVTSSTAPASPSQHAYSSGKAGHQRRSIKGQRSGAIASSGGGWKARLRLGMCSCFVSPKVLHAQQQQPHPAQKQPATLAGAAPASSAASQCLPPVLPPGATAAAPAPPAAFCAPAPSDNPIASVAHAHAPCGATVAAAGGCASAPPAALLAQYPFAPPVPPRVYTQAVIGAKRPEDLHKKTLVLDLDETLVHSSFKPIPNPDYIIPVEIDGRLVDVYVLKRPWLDHFLATVGPRFEVGGGAGFEGGVRGAC